MTDHESTITERVRRIAANHQGVAEDEIRTFGGVYMSLRNMNNALLNAAR